jgi:hypothetical protein
MAALTFGKRLRGERGAEIIEMALVTPIFLIIIAAMFDFGFLFRNWEVATNAAREGARIGLLPAYCDGAPRRRTASRFHSRPGSRPTYVVNQTR